MADEVNKESFRPESKLKSLLVIFFFSSLLEAGVIVYFLLSKQPPTNKQVTSATKRNDSLSLSFSKNPDPTSTPAPESRKFPLNKKFNFPVRAANGGVLGEIKYEVLEYEFTNQVVVNNYYKALVGNDKVILAVRIELTNDLNGGLKVLSGDYIRLTKNNEVKLIAPDIDSDPVEIRPRSTKETNIGFTLDKSDANLELQIGELSGEKELIEISKSI